MQMAKLEPGHKAPDFALTDQRGKTVKLKDYRGKHLVVYFYPKADTPGCTTQSCAVRDARPALSRLEAAAVSILQGKPEGHRSEGEGCA